jgi:hypothetical protein
LTDLLEYLADEGNAMLEKFEKALADISLAQGKEEVLAIENQLKELLKPDPSRLVEWIEETGRLTPVATESVVDLAGAYLEMPDHRPKLEVLLKKYCQDSHGWVRTKAQNHLEPDSVGLDGYRHGDRIYRKFLKPGFSVNRHDLRAQKEISLVVDIEEDWKEAYIGTFKVEGMVAQFLYLRVDVPDGETVQGSHGWLGLGRIFEPGRALGADEVLNPMNEASDPSEDVTALAREWTGSGRDGVWFFYAEGSLLPELAPDLYAQDPPDSILRKLPPL